MSALPRRTERRSEKTVFVLGAGFTRPARGPTQPELLQLLTAKRRLAPALKSFFSRVFQAETATDIARLSLEDVFTVLDRAVVFQENVRGISYIQADKVRRMLIREMVRLLSHRLDYPSEPHSIFARELLKHRLAAGPGGDPFSIISFNWDILLDKTLHQACCEQGTNRAEKARIDYCCYTYALEPAGGDEQQHISNLLAKDSGLLDLKILKLHGSVNWLLCPQCAKLFVSFDEKAGWRANNKCPVCRERPLLEPLIITPTLLKDLQTIQLKTVWHHTLTELQGASRLVFIGYSFPIADFEFRYLLAKGVRKDAIITVINRPQSFAKQLSQRQRSEFEAQKRTLENRYRAFFGARRIKFPDLGAEDFIVGDIWGN